MPQKNLDELKLIFREGFNQWWSEEAEDYELSEEELEVVAGGVEAGYGLCYITTLSWCDVSCPTPEG
ncbi:hypothetical protein H6S82_17470 [Planktothrix sp. FACHB-1355]|uniref:Uncharacterized protein n=1 Tax=Aerosakkonema funiforme FACHB-1375 TaxID=2949571 RepID=A0A926VEH7_9CYAN|nr:MULTISPECIES: hypothetical protein [Oscillatoriales]MBD2181467.1 hypothetical protein [Aerosakkonema funiforme FACHB-1375]MBD3560627.1 hypothetical protein [Planktothrix sp. FACHB-1355]